MFMCTENRVQAFPVGVKDLLARFMPRQRHIARLGAAPILSDGDTLHFFGIKSFAVVFKRRSNRPVTIAY